MISLDQTVIPIIRDEELQFSDGFSYIPNTTLTIEHDVHQVAVPMNANFDGGVFTFPSNSPFVDCFITWRGIGQKLFLEERSFRSPIQYSICLVFPHAPILPGTTFIVLEDVLFLVVPTQTSIHRFYIYLPKSNASKEPILSCFERNDELSVHHEAHSVQSQGCPIKASIAQSLIVTNVVLVSVDGMLIHVRWPTDKAIEVEETVLKGSGMIRRLLKRASTGFSREKDSHHALDVSVLPSTQQREWPLFYSIYRDLCVRVWNGEQRKLLKTIELEKFMGRINIEDVNDATLKTTTRENETPILLVTINTKDTTLFLLLKQGDDRFEKISLFTAPHSVSKSLLVDSSMKYLEDGYWKVIGLWNDSSASGRSSYRLLHITIEEIDSERENKQDNLLHPWRSIMTAASSSIVVTSDVTLEEIQSNLFNKDKHSLEVLTRAIQIVCRGQHNDSTTLTSWVELEKFVENYSLTSDFDEKFCNDGSLKRPDGFLQMLRKIGTKCIELERSMNSPIKVFQMSTDSFDYWGVLRHGSITIVEETSKDLLKSLSMNDFKASGRSMDDLVKHTEMAIASTSQEDEIDDDCVSAPPFPRFTSQEVEKILRPVEIILEHIGGMTERRKEMETETIDVNASSSHFLNGFIVSILQRNLKRGQATAHNLSLLCLKLREKQWLSDASKRCLTLYEEANKLDKDLKLLNDQLALNILWDNSYVTLGSWMKEGQRQSIVFPNGLTCLSNTTNEKQLNSFVQNFAQALLHAFHPSNGDCLLFKMLLQAKHYYGFKDLIKLTSLYEHNFLKRNYTETPTFDFYLGVAYSAAGYGEKALQKFSSCIAAGEKGDRGLAMTLSVHEDQISKNLMPTFFMEVISILSEHGLKEQVTSISQRARQYLSTKNAVYPRVCPIVIRLFTSIS